MTCAHATLTDNPRMVVCELGLYGGQPHVAVCRKCREYEGASRGLGDTIAKATKAVGIKPCSGCGRRQQALNDAIPYKDH